MKKMIPLLLAVFLFACGKSNWTKKYVYDDCLREMKKDSRAAKMFSDEKMKDICDCSAEKTVSKYKSESDARKDQSGLMQIGSECAQEILSK